MQTFVLKLIDSILNTFKSILMIKDKEVLSSVVNGVATMAYMTIIVDVETAFVVALATSIGSLISWTISKKIEKDKVYIFDIIPDGNENGKEFADNIRENNVPIMTYIGFGEDMSKVLCSKIYSHSKENSKLIESLIPDSFKYHVSEVKNYIET